ncbi:MAG: 2,3-diphosphoglycerate-dependent phosphoglycerate mutase [Methanotrichaceae archaeon]|nr:2,3-diphosphoglycerate-dependent phosphoglycerate mutase [Methanotrichaceae archaeon]
MPPFQLVILRHGQSLYNLERRFTGWIDIELTAEGEEEARRAGRILAREGFSFDIAFTSFLKRAIATLWLVLEEMDLMWIPVEKAWQLNERHYGALQGKSRDDVARRFSEDQVARWRRGFNERPPLLSTDDPALLPSGRYKDLLFLPRGESLKDALARVIPYWEGNIAPVVRSGKRVLIVAHGNSLRALVKHLGGITDADIVRMEIPTGIPIVIELDEDLGFVRSFRLEDA